MDFPIIDIADIEKPDFQLDIARQITKASQTWGFLLLKNHPIPMEDINEMFNLSRKFFVNTTEEMKDPWPINDRYVGYNRALTDRLANDKSSM
jgi:isopenicillin N synthase-like dioxygenase